MELEQCDESKSKEILDFIARRAGCSHMRFVMHAVNLVPKSGRLGGCMFARNEDVGLCPVIGEKQHSWKHLLTKMFKLSNDGYEIAAYVFEPGMKDRVTVMNSGTTLEQILVEMDLEINK